MKYFGRLIVLTTVFLVVTGMSQAQISVSGTEDGWYIEGQQYYKFSIYEPGVYRITGQQLESAGFPLNTTSPSEIRLFSFGLELPIYVSATGVFGPGDYIEFYAEGNDGTFDATLYENPAEQQLNPYHSLYTDSRPYYLTAAKSQNSLAPKRYQQRDNGLNGPGLPPLESFYLHRIDTVFSDFHFKPTHDGRNYIRYSSMDVAEGFGSHLANETTLDFKLPDFVPRTLDVKLRLRFGTNVLSRSHTIYVNDFAVKNISQTGFGVVDVSLTVDRQLIETGKLKLTLRGLTGALDKHTLAYLEIQYPRIYDFQEKNVFQFIQQPSIISRYVEIDNFNIGSTARLYNLNKDYYIDCDIVGGKVRFVAPSAFTSDQMILVSDAGIKSVGELREVVIDPQIQNADYLILTHPEFINEAAADYAEYRRSVEGGGYDVQITDVTAIYDAFGFGIEGHTASLVNYFDALEERGVLPDYVFIIGKGLEYSEGRKDSSGTSFVPTYGVPGADNLLIRTTDARFPAVPVGRLAAKNNTEVRAYLNKVKEQENPGPSEQSIVGQRWKKSFIHLSGGSADIQGLLFSFLEDMESIVAYNKIGAEVTTFRKTSADPIQQAQSQQIVDQVNQGAAIITFFGHSAVGTFDFSLEDPSRYENDGKNPIIISLGCHSGNIHTSFPGVSEEFVLQESSGAIAFIASSGTAFPGPQYSMGASIYDLMGGTMYGMPLGDILQTVIIEQSAKESIDIQTLAQQFTLHGDPAYRNNGFKGPDFVPDRTTVNIQPELLNSSSEKFSVRFDVVNLGSALDRELDVRIVHVAPDGVSQDTLELTIPAPFNRAPIEVEFNNPGQGAVGINRILIEVDPFNKIEELPGPDAESNNILITNTGEEGYRFFILDNSARPLYPENYSIVANIEELELVSVINNALSPGGTFIVQLDTTSLFNSPLFIAKEINNSSSFVSWQPKVEWLPGTVYYWRIRPQDEEIFNLKNSVWRTSSFVYRPEDEQGWNQSHHYQWLDNEFYKTRIGQGRNLEYATRNWDIRIKNELGDPSDFWVFVNNTPWASLNPKEFTPGIAVFAWNEQDVIVENSGNDFGSIPFSKDGFVFDVKTPEGRKGLMDLLEYIPEDSRVFIHTILSAPEDDLNIEEWASDQERYGEDLFDTFERFGASKVRNLLERGTVPYTLVFDKGTGPVIEDIANQIEETIDLSATARSIWDEGEETSVYFGPADRWMRLKWEEDKEGDDETELHVYGVRPNGQEELLKEVRNDYDVNLTSINPFLYPKLKLKYITSDYTQKTCAQLINWRIYYTPLPDPAIFSDQLEFEIADTVNAGQDLELKFEVRNLTEANLEPVLVRFRLTNDKNEEAVFVRRIDPIPGKGSIAVEEDIPTFNLSGTYRVELEINPNGELREVTDCNNYGFTQVYIRPDRSNPLLDVTFDGRHIRNRELIHQTPEISISLYDENKYVLLDDSSLFDVSLIYPGALKWNVKAGDKGVKFIPATDPANNIARLLIHPNLNVDGRYALEVQAKDIAGNTSGKQRYRVEFEVGDYDYQEPFRIYPNPVQTKTTIEYFLQAEREPEVFLFRIYTTNGILVKTLYASDFGGIRPGINSVVWDASDESGRPLINGAYFYELITDLELKKDKKRGTIILMR